MMEHYVYVVATIRDGKHAAPIKIGITANMKSRLRALQTGSPYPVDVAFAVPVENTVMAVQIERMLHKTFSRFRMHGEWFDLLPVYGVHCLATAIELFRCGGVPMFSQHRQILCDRFGVTAALHYCEEQLPGFISEGLTA